MNKKAVGLVSLAAILIFAATIYGVLRSAARLPHFWESFVPGVWANIMGVSVAAIIGVPVGFAINHWVVTITERRHRKRQIAEVQQLLEQVRNELNLHLTTIPRLTTIFAIQNWAPVSLPGAEVASLLLQDTFGRQFIGNHSVLDIGESLVLFQISNYYTRVGELNRLLAFRIQETQHPETWDRRIADMASSVSVAKAQADYEIQQAVARLTGKGGN